MDEQITDLLNLSNLEYFGAQAHTDYPDFSRVPVINPEHFINRKASKKLLISPQSIDIKGIDLLQDSLWQQNTSSRLNLSNYIDIESVREKLASAESLVLVNALEYLEDIRPLLSVVRDMCTKSGKKVVICGAVAVRSELYGYRQWDKNGMRKLLTSSGFIVANDSSTGSVYSFEVTCSKSDYDNFLKLHHLPKSTFSHLLVTTEHSAYRVTGGIGSYINECDQLYGDDSAVLIIDNNRDVDEVKIRSNRWLSAQAFLSRDSVKQIEFANYDTMADLVFEALKSILFFYPDIQNIECQEMGLYRTIEAKKIGQIPSTIKLITTCHGSSFHLAKARRDVLELENIHVAYREKFTLEESDVVILPTRFLKESYIDNGILNLEDKSRVIKRLPFNYTRLPEGAKLVGYKRLIYVGKTSTIKGFDLFLETLIRLKELYPDITRTIEEVSVYATSIDVQEKHLQTLLEKVKSNYSVGVYSLDREELLNTLAETSRDSLALVTYTGDNHPMAVLELMSIGHDFLAARAGGTPELIAKTFSADFLVEPNADDFARAVKKSINTVGQRSERTVKLRKHYKNEQDIINSTYSLKSLDQLQPISRESAGQAQEVDIEIIDTGKKEDIENTLKSLELQQVDFKATIIQNSGYTAVYARDHIRLYAGDLLRPRALEYMSRLLHIDNGTDAVMVYETVPTYLGNKLEGITFFTPYPPEIGSVYLQEKYNRRVIVLFKKSTVKREDNFSDWQNTIAIASLGRKIRVFPALLADIVVLENYAKDNVLDNFSKMAHAYKALPVFDAYILNYQLKRLDDMYFGSKLFNHLEDLYIRKDHPSITYGLSPDLKTVLAVYDRYTPKIIKKTIHKTTRVTYKAARKIKKSLKKS